MRTPILIAIALVCAASQATAGIQILDGASSAGFTNLQSAINAAADGAVILLGNGTYGSAVIDGKSLVLVEAPGRTATISGTLTVRNLSARQAVIVQGLDVEGTFTSPTSNPAVVLSADQGHVRFQDCALRGSTRGAPALRASGCLQVALANCTLHGGTGGGSGTQFGSGGGAGGAGIDATQSAIALYDCICAGGNGGEGELAGGAGGQAYNEVDFGFFASGTSFLGGNGGYAWGASTAQGGNGGDGVHLAAAAFAKFLGSSYQGGKGGGSFLGLAHFGSDGAPVGGPGPAQVLAGTARHANAAAVISDDGAWTITVSGQPGDEVRVASLGRPGFAYDANESGTWLVAPPRTMTVDPLVTLGASGSASFQVPAADVAGATPTRVRFAQVRVTDANGVSWLSSPLHLVVLNRHGLPDCNGNGALDVLDVIEGTSADCDGNLRPDGCDSDCDGNGIPDACELDCNANGVPDHCDLILGTSPDCNGNGIPDECDIAAGTLADANHNGIPDMCEPTTVTRYVDASAPPGGDGSSAHPFNTIGAGVLGSLSGDTLIVEDGMYTGVGNGDVNFAGKNLTIRSRNGNANCVMTSPAPRQAFQVLGLETNVRIEGITFFNFMHANGDGGAIDLAPSGIGCVVTITDCVFDSCLAYFGGAIHTDLSPTQLLVLQRCRFTNNYAYSTAGAVRALGPARIEDCTFVNNRAVDEAGAVYFDGGTSTTLPTIVSRCRFTGNSARNAGAISVNVPGFVVEDCLFAGNHASASGGAILRSGYSAMHLQTMFVRSSTFAGNHADTSGGAIWDAFATDVTTANCILWNDTSPSGPEIFESSGATLHASSSDVQGGQAQIGGTGTVLWGAGMFASDPLFADADGADNDPTTFGDNDYSLASNSPCIDAGDVNALAIDVLDADHDGNSSEFVPFDLSGATRRVDISSVPDTGLGLPPLPDMGCFERQI